MSLNRHCIYPPVAVAADRPCIGASVVIGMSLGQGPGKGECSGAVGGIQTIPSVRGSLEGGRWWSDGPSIRGYLEGGRWWGLQKGAVSRADRLIGPPLIG